MSKLLTALMLVLVAVASAAWADETFKATLSGDQEVPPVVTDTTGRFKLQLNQAETEAEITLTVNDGVRIRQAHLHCAPVGGRPRRTRSDREPRGKGPACREN